MLVAHIAGRQHVFQRLGRAVMQIGGRAVNPEQRRRIVVRAPSSRRGRRYRCRHRAAERSCRRRIGEIRRRCDIRRSGFPLRRTTPRRACAASDRPLSSIGTERNLVTSWNRPPGRRDRSSAPCSARSRARRTPAPRISPCPCISWPRMVCSKSCDSSRSADQWIGMRPGHAVEGGCVPQAFGVLPGPAVGIAVGMAAGARNPAPPDHRLQCRIKQDLPAEISSPSGFSQTLIVARLRTVSHCRRRRR